MIEKINAYVFQNNKSIFKLLANADRSLRWVSDKPLIPKQSFDVFEDHMDAFIDKHLWFLPIPRFGRNIEVEASFETILKGASIALNTICDDRMSYAESEQNPLVIIDAMYSIGWPHIAFLRRQGRRLLAAQSYVLCLMALNARDLSLVQKETIESIEFVQLARSIIQEEIGASFLDGPDDFLNAVSEHLRKKAYCKIKDKCPKASSTWLNYDDLKSQSLLSDDVVNQVESFKTDWLSQGLRREDLNIKISSLLDEKPEIGIF